MSSTMIVAKAHASAEGNQPFSSSIIPSEPTREMPTTLAQCLSASAPRGLDLLFAASQVKVKPKVTTEAEAEADSVKALAEVPFPSTITVVSTGTGTGRAEPGDESVGKPASCDEGEEEGAPSSEHDGEKPTNDADAVNDKDQKDNVKTFPQVLQIILNTPEYESIAHWLPDGLSFLIVDKQRFSDEILPKYFHRVSLYHSFIRKLNRYGFRRVKGSCKGEESSFAHNNFVRDKPWLCLKMNCQSKPSYHKAPLATMMPKSHQAAVEAIDSNRFANAAGAGVIAMPIAISPPSIGVGGMMDADSRAFVATSRPMSYMPAGASHSAAVLPMTTAAIDPTIASTIAGATAAAIQERQLQLQLQLRLRLEAPILTVPVHSQQRQRILHEMQMRTLQMRQCHRRQVQLQLQLQRLHEMSAYDEDHVHSTSSSYGSYIQSSLMAQCTSDMLRRNIFN